VPSDPTAKLKDHMSTLNKVLITLGIIVTLGLLSFIVYQQHQISSKQDAIEKQVVLQKELNDKIVRAQAEYATRKDLENFIKNSGADLKEIQKDLNKLSADIVSANKVVVNSDGFKGDHIASSTTTNSNQNPTLPICKDGTVCPNVDPYGYLTKQQNLKFTEAFGKDQVPIGEVGFSSWQDKPWNLNLSPRQYQLVTVVGEDENQRQYYYNKFSIRVDGKNYDVKINSSQTKQEVPEAKFSFWNPRLFLGVDGGLNLNQFKGEWGPSLSVGLMSYGQFKNIPDFSILQLGLGYGVVENKLEVLFTPFAYNIGKHLPLTNNLYLGPSLIVDSSGHYSIMGSIRVGL
jgi:hypothetical protein